VRPRSQSDLTAFLQRYGGTVVGDNSVPEPPPNLGVVLTDAQRQATEYLVSIDLSRVDPSTFGVDGAALGLYGALEVSSTDALLTLAATANARATGFSAVANYVHHSRGFPRALFSTRERPAPLPGGGMGWLDAMTFPRFATTGSQSNVTLAWQFVSAHGIARRVAVAIIDGGFWLNTDGSARGTDYDWPVNPVQYDFVDDDRIADGPNPTNCTGGSSCFWHGTGSAGTATGILDDQRGAAGTGGLVADPWLFKVGGSKAVEHRAIRTAVVWGADVVSMSFGGDCNKPCRIYDRDDTPFDDAVHDGFKTVFVASAGNGEGGNGYDTGAERYVHPCIEDHVLCVGALEDDTSTRKQYSNFGSSVQIYAPTDIGVMSSPDGSDNDPNGAAQPQVHTGTSAAAPFISGVVAMMKAINPALDGETVANMLKSTAHHAPPVDNYVDAYAAVRAAAKGIDGVKDGWEPNDDSDSAQFLPEGETQGLSLSTAFDVDMYRIHLSSPSQVALVVAAPPALGEPAVARGYGLEADSVGCGHFREISRGSPDAGEQVMVYAAPAGNYLIEISGDLNAYNLSWSKQPLPPPDPVAPDPFEPNDVKSQATDLGAGRHGTATLTPGDVDYYRFQSSGTIDNTYLHAESGFHVTATDVPVTVALYGEDGFPVGAPVTGSSSCQGFVGFAALPAGVFYAKVLATTPGTQGTYSFYGGSTAKGGIGPMHDRVFERLHPGDPVEGLLQNKYDGYIFTLGPEVSGIGLSSQSPLHQQVFDVQGNLLVEGQAQFTQGQGDFESLSLGALAVGTDYLLQIGRVGALVEPAPPSVAPVAYALSWNGGVPARDSGNLIPNGNAEDPNQGASEDGSVVHLHDWVPAPGSSLTVVFYGGTELFPQLTDPGPPNRGNHFFAGGPGNDTSSASQVIDLGVSNASWFTAIDANKVTYVLSGYLGGYGDEEDRTMLRLTFLDGSATQLGETTIGPVTAAERDDHTGTFLRQTDGSVPVGTRQIAVQLQMTRSFGTYNDGYADNLELHFQDWSQ